MMPNKKNTYLKRKKKITTRMINHLIIILFCSPPSPHILHRTSSTRYMLTFEYIGFFGMMIGDDEPINRCPPAAFVNFSN
jgi:hypothetical protein